MIRKKMRHVSALLASLLLLSTLTACGEEEIAPWTDREFEEILGKMEELGKGYAVLDICMPMLEEDDKARADLMNVIMADRYTKLEELDTERERDKVFAYYEARGGSPEQNALMRDTYEASYEAALDEITSIDVCVETISDYANTLIYMRVSRGRL